MHICRVAATASETDRVGRYLAAHPGPGGPERAETEAIMMDQTRTTGCRPDDAPAGDGGAARPAVVGRARWQAQLDGLLAREKAHTREGDAIAAARRRLPMVEVDPAIPLTGGHGPVPLLEVFEGRRQLLAGRWFGMQVCYLRAGDRVFETYWSSDRATEVLAPSYGLLDMTVYGRQETWDDSPAGWPQPFETDGGQFCVGGRPAAQWSRLAAGRSDDLSARRPAR
jgi:hypothetical protein